MSDGKKIRVVISPLGKPTVEAIGFNGVGCQAATSSIEKALAADADGGVSRTLKPEWTNDEAAGNEQHEAQSW